MMIMVAFVEGGAYEDVVYAAWRRAWHRARRRVWSYGASTFPEIVPLMDVAAKRGSELWDAWASRFLNISRAGKQGAPHALYMLWLWLRLGAMS